MRVVNEVMEDGRREGKRVEEGLGCMKEKVDRVAITMGLRGVWRGGLAFGGILALEVGS